MGLMQDISLENELPEIGSELLGRSTSSGIIFSLYCLFAFWLCLNWRKLKINDINSATNGKKTKISFILSIVIFISYWFANNGRNQGQAGFAATNFD